MDTVSDLGRRTGRRPVDIRSFRARTDQAVVIGQWFYHVMVHSTDYIVVGWCEPSFMPDPEKAHETGEDAISYGYAAHLGRRIHGGVSEPFGRCVQKGDIIGCLLDCDAGCITFTLNGQLLTGPAGLRPAYTGINAAAGLLPVISLASGQEVTVQFSQANQGQFSFPDPSATYQPFGHRLMQGVSMWYCSRDPRFRRLGDVTRCVL